MNKTQATMTELIYSLNPFSMLAEKFTKKVIILD